MATKAPGGQFPFVLGLMPFWEKGNPSFETIFTWATASLNDFQNNSGLPASRKRLFVFDSFYISPKNLQEISKHPIYFLGSLHLNKWQHIIDPIKSHAKDPKSYAASQRIVNAATGEKQVILFSIYSWHLLFQ